jgi:hypothetical protein
LIIQATEEIVETLKSGEDENVDKEEKYAITSVFAECGGLEVCAVGRPLGHTE